MSEMGGKQTLRPYSLAIAQRRLPDICRLRMDAAYVARMKYRLENMRKIAAMAHDPRIIELVTVTADQLEEDIRKLEAEASAPVTIHVDPPPQV